MTLKEERARTSREERGKFFYGLANATFIGMVLGSMISLLTNQIDVFAFSYLLSIGVLGTTVFAIIANSILSNN